MSKKNDDDQPTKRTLVDRLTSERNQLAANLEKLDAFMQTPVFHLLELEERDRLKGQRTAMGHYREILSARIAYHQAREAK